MRGLLLGLALAFAPMAAFAQTPEQAAAIARASEVGQQLYDHDRAAWLATDAMLAAIRDPRREGIHGWVTERNGDGSVTVLFVRVRGDELSAAYRAVYRNEALTEQGRAEGALTSDQTRLYRARLMSMGASFQACSRNYNSVTLPRAQVGQDGADVDVYLMPGTSTAGEHLFGGYFRFGVDTAAGFVRETQRFTNSCLALNNSELAPGGQVRMLWVTQVIGDTPTEVHVFQSLSSHLPVFVGTSAGMWEVNGAAIRLVPPEEQPRTQP